MTDYLKMIRAAYYEAGRAQPSEYDPLPSWESLPVQLREALIVWHDGHKHGGQEERGRPRGN